MSKKVILVAGLGLIGGSLAKGMALVNEHHVIGYDIDEQTLEFALENGIIHEITSNFVEAAQRAEMIFLASPISATISLLHELDRITFDHDVIVSDASSVKGAILDTANNLENEHLIFVGGHPMAGSHKKGVQAAKTHLFENAIYVLTPGPRCKEEHIEEIKSALVNTQSHFLTLNSDEHDEMTGIISHFPHLLASSLVQQASKWQRKHPYLRDLAAGGFRDITRIASSNPYLWQDIFHHNQEKLLLMLDNSIEEMNHLKQLIVENRKEEMISYLQEAKDYRDGLGTKKKGALPSFFDIYVDIRDQTGAIAKVVQLLAEHDISLRNFRILEIREGIMGALRISLGSWEDHSKACEILKSNDYDIMVEI
ncbi:prephenate dehydrogenase [Aciduricibacillus chroicocephali]|uniref:Prephenate dehydrogenase n=1 Tax=Aciduricibacillus chroicocephali TaxID=3054939 RepID=A0ABY9KRJ1_9BACI|nr:prephenate dehydrogenase [Bacillaceae bacterium 44XB]